MFQGVFGYHPDFSKTKAELFISLSPILLFLYFPLFFLPSYFHSSVKHQSSCSFWWCFFLGLTIGSHTLGISSSFCLFLHIFPFLLPQSKFLSKAAFFPVLSDLPFFFFLLEFCSLFPLYVYQNCISSNNTPRSDYLSVCNPH